MSSEAGTRNSGSGSSGLVVALGNGQGSTAVDHARQAVLPEPQIVDQSEARLADKAGALGNACLVGSERRFPCARHHQCLPISFGAQPFGEGAMLTQGQAPAGQVGHNRLAHSRHVIEQRRDQGSCQNVDSPGGDPLLQQPHDRVAAHEIADPHVRHDQDWSLMWVHSSRARSMF